MQCPQCQAQIPIDAVFCNKCGSRLETARWQVAGENDAARLPGINPSTLTSGMKALGISRRR
jgi:hypothetical protein